MGNRISYWFVISYLTIYFISEFSLVSGFTFDQTFHSQFYKYNTKTAFPHAFNWNKVHDNTNLIRNRTDLLQNIT